MASFTDSPVSFTPYVSQQPVEAMDRVGMLKEQQFQQGIQEVQSWQDGLLALPIAKAETQKYVRDQVSRLRSSISTSIAGDFSDQRVINQIGGLAKKIDSDPIVENGVRSTQAIKSGMAAMEQSKKDKTWSIQNEAKFNTGVSKWLNDGDVQTSFSDTYKPWVDYMDRFMKLYKEVHPGENIDQDAFRTETNPITGEQEVKRNPTLKSGVTPAKIQNVWNIVTSSPDVQEQLSTDGWYKFRGATPQDIAVNLQTSTNQSLASIEAAIRQKQVEISSGSSSNTVQTSQEIEQLKNTATQYKKSADGIISHLAINPEAAKASIVQQDMLSNLMGAYSYETLKKSPLWETTMEEAKFKNQIEEFNMTFAETKRMNDWQILKGTAELSNKKTKDKQDEADAIGFITPAPVSSEQGNLGSVSAAKDVEDSKFQYVQAQRELTSALAGAGKKPFIYNPVSKLWEANVGPDSETQYPTEGYVNQASQQYLAAGRDQYINGAVGDEVVRDLFQNSDAAYSNLQAKKKVIADVTKFHGADLENIKKELGDNASTIQLGERQVKLNTTDFVDVYTVTNKLPGNEGAYSRLEKKYGDVPSFMQTAVWAEDASGNRIYTRVANALGKSKKLIPTVQKIENEYRKRQTTTESKDVTFPETEAAIDTQRAKFFRLADAEAQLNDGSNKGAANDLIAMIDQNDKNSKGNHYSAGFNSATGRGYIAVKRAGEPEARLEMPAQRFFSVYPEFVPNNTFNKLYGAKLATGQGNTQNAGNPSRAGGYQINLPPDYPYTLQYHLQKKGEDSYDMLLWVTPKPTADNKSPEPIINGERANGTIPGFPQNASEAEIVQWTQNGLRNVNFINQYLQSKKK